MPDVWDGSILLPGETLDALALRLGGRVVGSQKVAPRRVAPLAAAGEGDLAPVLASRYLKTARQAAERGAALLVDASMEAAMAWAPHLWMHEHATWALAGVLDRALVPDAPPVVGEGSRVAPTCVIGPRVVIGARVTIGAGAVVGHPGFGWARGPGGVVRAVPQLGGVVLEDDVSIGPLCTVDAGTLASHAHPPRCQARRARPRRPQRRHRRGHHHRGAVRARRIGDPRPRGARRGPGWLRRPRHGGRRRARRRQERRDRRCTPPGPSWQDTRPCRARGGCGHWLRFTVALLRVVRRRRRETPTPSRSTASCRSCRTAGRSCWSIA